MVPHKRQDLVIRAFATLPPLAPGRQAVLVGVPLSPAFGEQLRELAQELAPGGRAASSTESAPSSSPSATATADAFLCLSEHEGFCIPLLEAFHFGVPVIARDVGAIGEVVGDAGVLLGSERQPRRRGRAAEDRGRGLGAAGGAPAAAASAGSSGTRTTARPDCCARR